MSQKQYFLNINFNLDNIINWMSLFLFLQARSLQIENMCLRILCFSDICDSGQLRFVLFQCNKHLKSMKVNFVWKSEVDILFSRFGLLVQNALLYKPRSETRSVSFLFSK